MNTDYSFDLPEVPSNAVSRPRVHMSTEATCTACEG